MMGENWTLMELYGLLETTKNILDKPPKHRGRSWFHNEMWKAMWELSISVKLIALIKMCVSDSKSAARIGTLLDYFHIYNGLRQAYALSLLLFKIALEEVMKITVVHKKIINFLSSKYHHHQQRCSVHCWVGLSNLSTLLFHSYSVSPKSVQVIWPCCRRSAPASNSTLSWAPFYYSFGPSFIRFSGNM